MSRSISRLRYFVKRKFKRTSNRKLSSGDISVLNFLWTWKVASTQMLKFIGYPVQTHWWGYKAIKQLEREQYIQILPCGKNLNQEVWTLTQNGFEVVLMDRDDIVEYRFKPHAPAHDYFATCLQLGDLWTSNWPKTFFTEQMLSSLRKSNFPENFTSDEGHVPDGITMLIHELKETYIGYEVDLNLKDMERYTQTSSYYGKLNNQVSVVFWLVRNDWIAGRIQSLMDERSHFSKVRISFILLDDFKKDIWSAKVYRGKYAGHAIRKIHENIMQSLGKPSAMLGQKSMSDIFFSKYKSPQKSMTSVKVDTNEIL